MDVTLMLVHLMVADVARDSGDGVLPHSHPSGGGRENKLFFTLMGPSWGMYFE
jgi:hypothetical protein